MEGDEQIKTRFQRATRENSHVLLDRLAFWFWTLFRMLHFTLRLAVQLLLFFPLFGVSTSNAE